MNENKTIGSVLIVGGGIGGMQSALDLAESGFKVYLADSAPAIGGTMAALDKTFPTNDCSMCIMAPKLVECGRHLNIEIITLADIEAVSGEPGNFQIDLIQQPRFVDLEKCTGCGLCVNNCPVRYIPHFEQNKYSEPELDSEEKQKIDKILESHSSNAGSLVPILQEISQEFNYLPEKILVYLSLRIDIPLSRLYNVATFYKAFSLEPRGKHLITVCLGTACHVRGAPRILEELERVLNIKDGETTADGNFTLETVNCLGACALGPIVTGDGEYHGNMTIAKISKMIDSIKR